MHAATCLYGLNVFTTSIGVGVAGQHVLGALPQCDGCSRAYLVSCILYLVSCILYLVSCIVYRVSCILPMAGRGARAGVLAARVSAVHTGGRGAGVGAGKRLGQG